MQTPTLALIVKREQEIEQFVSEPFWEVIGTFDINGKQYQGKWINNGESRIKSRKLAEKIARFAAKKGAEVSGVKVEKKEQHPPLLYNLSALQAEANKRFKFSPKKTLDILQQLYQKGIISYPRSDSRYVTAGEAESFPEILSKLEKIRQYSGLFPLPVKSIKHNKRYVNEKKVTDHYAIIPTEQVPNMDKLNDGEKKLYDLVARSIIAAHYGKSVAEHTTVTTLVDGRAEFETKGKVLLEEGWRKVIFPDGKEKEESLPSLAAGEKGMAIGTEIREGKTEPPKRYTEGQLITLMKTAGKHIEDKELEKVLMKTEGLGTEATRAAIITMLKERKYIEIKKNIVYPTAKAKILIHSIGKEILASPEMTAKWEQRLKEISEGKASPKQFMEQTKKMIFHLIAKIGSESENWMFDENLKEEFVPERTGKNSRQAAVGLCKKCGGTVVDKGSFYGCSNYGKNQCDFTVSKKILGKAITKKQIKNLLTEGKTDVIKGFKGKEKTFDAMLCWDEKEQKLAFAFNSNRTY